MHAERDHLENVVFPELKERLRERRCLLEPIDLRVGVETASLAEEQKELEVLKVCLAEIERSRPFLLVLLGDRYGWTPPEARIAAAAQEAGFMIDVRGRSVTALEIEYGILKKYPNQRRRSLFYFREPLPYAQMPREIAARYSDEHSTDPAVRAGFVKLQVFKNRVQHDGELRARVHAYSAAWDVVNQRVTGLAAWGNQVRDDLWSELDEETREFARKGERTWEEQEHDALEEFVEQRARDFVGREDIADKLLTLAHSPVAPDAQWCACVVGESGLGKSALFAHLHRELSTTPSPQHSNNPILLLSHAGGISPQSVQVHFMLRRWVRELAHFLQVPFPIPPRASAEQVEKAFADSFSRASEQRRIVMLIDALNQFEPSPRTRQLAWLPKPWPPNARFIVTAIAGEQADAIAKWRGTKTEQLSPLSISEAEAIALKVTRRFHRMLNPQVLEAVLSKRTSDGDVAARNPLWLELALEQLNLLDEDDYIRADREFDGTPGQRLLQMVLRVAAELPSDIAGLYEWLLSRTEKVSGMYFARAFADLIALSRFGWRESDFRVMLPAAARVLFPRQSSDGQRSSLHPPHFAWDPLRFAQIRRGFGAHIVRRGALERWDFYHTQTREAVRRRNLGASSLAIRTSVLVSDLESVIACHLNALPGDDPLRFSTNIVSLLKFVAQNWPNPVRLRLDENVQVLISRTGFSEDISEHVVEEYQAWLEGGRVNPISTGVHALHSIISKTNPQSPPATIALAVLLVDIVAGVIRPGDAILRSSLFALKMVAQAYRLPYQAARIPAEQIFYLERPVLCHFKDERFVVLTSFDNNRVRFEECSSACDDSREEFLRRLSGAVFAPASSLKQVRDGEEMHDAMAIYFWG